MDLVSFTSNMEGFERKTENINKKGYAKFTER